MTDSLGIWLRRSREARRLDLDEVVQALRIHRRYLQALELGDYEALPGPIQARGFLRNYARFLGVPVEDALARYDAEIRGLPVQPRMPEIEVPVRRGERTWAPPPPSADEDRAAVRANSSSRLMKILVIAVLFFGLIALASYAWLEFGPGDLLGAEPTPPPASQAAVNAATPTATASPPPVFPISEDGMVRVRLLPESHAWISVSADATVAFQGIAEPQQVVDAVADEILIVTTGNGGAFRLFVNGTDWGMLGEQGEILRRAWTPQGETSLED